MDRLIYTLVVILTSFAIFIGCSNPTELFDGEYQPDLDATLKINKYQSLKYIEEYTQHFSIDSGIIRCGIEPIIEWRLLKPRIDGNILKAKATKYIDKEKSDSHAIMWECLNSPENGNMFEEEISLNLTKGKLSFCYWTPGNETSKFCAILFREKFR